MYKAGMWVAGLFLVVGAMAFSVMVTPAGKNLKDDAYPECPHDWGTFEVRDPKGVAPASSHNMDAMPTVQPAATTTSYGMRLPSRISNVPEYHDCQRMREMDGVKPTYGALIAVFAHDSLANMDTTVMVNKHVVAELFVADANGRYDKLHIATTFSCLVMQYTKSKWQAWMVATSRESQCDREFLASEFTPGNELDVKPKSPPAGETVQAVARWDWDPADTAQYIGVRCGAQWCEVGQKGFQASTSYVGNKLLEGKGNYDEQQLAEYPPGQPITPGALTGTVVPTEELVAMKALSKQEQYAAFHGAWRHVAHVYMRPDAGSYDASSAFIGSASVPPNDRRAEIALCQGGWRACKPAGLFTYFKPGRCKNPVTGDVWYAEVRRPGQAPRYFCVVYRWHEGASAIPPVTRWRWRAVDEGIWISCPDGCCETNAFF